MNSSYYSLGLFILLVTAALGPSFISKESPNFMSGFDRSTFGENPSIVYDEEITLDAGWSAPTVRGRTTIATTYNRTTIGASPCEILLDVVLILVIMAKVAVYCYTFLLRCTQPAAQAHYSVVSYSVSCRQVPTPSKKPTRESSSGLASSITDVPEPVAPQEIKDTMTRNAELAIFAQVEVDTRPTMEIVLAIFSGRMLTFLASTFVLSLQTANRQVVVSNIQVKQETQEEERARIREEKLAVIRAEIARERAERAAIKREAAERRAQKEKEDREAAERIQALELAKRHNKPERMEITCPRSLQYLSVLTPEQRRFDRRRQALKLKEISVEMKGNCMFQSVSLALKGTTDDHVLLRARACDWLRKNANYEVLPGIPLSAVEGAEGPEWDRFVQEMACSCTFGTNACLYALAECTATQFWILTGSKGNEYISEIVPKTVVARNVVKLANYSAHFNVLVEDTDEMAESSRKVPARRPINMWRCAGNLCGKWNATEALACSCGRSHCSNSPIAA